MVVCPYHVAVLLGAAHLAVTLIYSACFRLKASHSYMSTSWNSYYAGRKESTDPSPRCCLAEECTRKDKGRYTILTTLRTDKYLPLLEVGLRLSATVSQCPDIM